MMDTSHQRRGLWSSRTLVNSYGRTRSTRTQKASQLIPWSAN